MMRTHPSPQMQPEEWDPEWKRAACLGCDRRVVRARDSWLEVAGTEDRTYLVAWGAAPRVAYGTDPDPDRILDEAAFMYGVAHHDCMPAARFRLETRTANLPATLTDVQVEQGAAVPMPEYTLHLPADAGSCPFCGASESMTDEHIWPEWFSRDLQARGLVVRGDGARGRTINITVPVCETCNNTWMSVLENDVSPILRRLMFNPGKGAATGASDMVITKEEQKRLAAWATMKAYLIDMYDQPCVPRGFMHEFALRRVPNESTRVWLGQYAPDLALQGDKQTFDFQTPHGPTNNSPNAFMVTFTIFDVLFQVISHFNGGPAKVNGSRPQYDEALVSVVPPRVDGMPWPPAFAFDKDSWDDLIASISDGSDGSGLSG